MNGDENDIRKRTNKGEYSNVPLDDIEQDEVIAQLLASAQTSKNIFDVILTIIGIIIGMIMTYWAYQQATLRIQFFLNIVQMASSWMLKMNIFFAINRYILGFSIISIVIITFAGHVIPSILSPQLLTIESYFVIFIDVLVMIYVACVIYSTQADFLTQNDLQELQKKKYSVAPA